MQVTQTNEIRGVFLFGETQPAADSVGVSWGARRWVFDTRVPGINPTVVQNALQPAKGPPADAVHVLWHKIDQRAAVHHIFDTLAMEGIATHPTKQEALSAWDDAHPSGRGGALIPAPSGPADEPSSRGTVVVTVTAEWTELLHRSEDTLLLNHVWVVCEALRFPVSLFETHHVSVANEICDRLVNLKNAPRAFVRAYRFRGVVCPLVLWHTMHEPQVVCMVQELMHIRFHHIPQACVWHWQLVPHPTALSLIGERFHAASILPSWSGFVEYATPGGGDRSKVSFEVLTSIAGRDDPARMHTEYSNGVCVLWIGTELFFYVESVTESSVTNVRLPESHADLPPWVISTLCTTVSRANADESSVRWYVDKYLESFLIVPSRLRGPDGTDPAKSVAPAIRLLRSINWAGCPLVWRPLFLRDTQPRIQDHECREAQVKLIKGVATMWEDAETVASAIETLHHITMVGVRSQ